jgi:hypothetical protein
LHTEKLLETLVICCYDDKITKAEIAGVCGMWYARGGEKFRIDLVGKPEGKRKL